MTEPVFFVLANSDGNRLLDHYTYTWTVNADGTCMLTVPRLNATFPLTYDAARDAMTDQNNVVHYRLDPLTGIWAASGDGAIPGLKSTMSAIFKADGSGYIGFVNDDNTLQVMESTWRKNADGTYAISYADEFTETFTMSPDKKSIVSDSSNSKIEKKFMNSYYYLSVLGPWYSEENQGIVVFSADGTGRAFTLDGGLSAAFTWTIPEFGKFCLHIESGKTYGGEDVAGTDRIWTYDRENNTFTTPDGSVFIRPSQAVGKLTFTTFTTEPIVGQWTTKYQVGGKTVDAVMTLKKDGDGYWMTLGDVEGIQLTAINKDTWKKTGENTYQVTGSSGRIYEEVYDPVACTLTEDGTTVYTRLDPIVGIWHGQTASGDGGEISTIIKSDGTGVGTVSYDNGTSEVSRLTWKKNSDGTYVVAYSTGYTATYTVDSAGTRIVSSSGSIKEKAFLDSTFLMSIVGAWYNQDKDASYVFNADGTGFGFANGGMMPFTWNLKELGEFELAYTDEAGSVDSDLVGKTFVWTYDRKNNVFTSSAGTKYIRPAESVKDKITLFS